VFGKIVVKEETAHAFVEAVNAIDFITNQYYTVITNPPHCASHETFLIPIRKEKQSLL
jgi:hypothetical protein